MIKINYFDEKKLLVMGDRDKVTKVTQHKVT